MSSFFASKAVDPFVAYSISHLSMILLFGFFAVLLFTYRNSLKVEHRKKWIRNTLIGLLIVSEISLQIWFAGADMWDPYDTLPLQLCSISLILSIIMLIMNSYRVFEVAYFFGLAGASQALLTPELFFDFPHYRYFHFFIAHIAIMLSCLYMVWIEKFYPTFYSIWKAIFALNVIAFFVFWVNKWTGGNYMFLARKPTNASLLDFLGPYPYYILTLEAVTVFLFTLLYLPFWLIQKRTKV
ncbi:TIGR02206 family membrane protein [Bacillus sp. DJP31]|uniref:YwaF family protein n=1 Tax=Bacillus sp. DJP31 TaxID=3409789 RepID=UPI003BB5CBF8